MTEQELIRRLRDERPAPPAGFEERQDRLLLSLIQKEEKPIMKKKMSAALVFALVLALLSVSAFAASLMFSPRADAGLRADKILEEKYGITREMQVFFHRSVNEYPDGSAVVTYTGNWDLAYVLGEYTVNLNGKEATAAWSHDGEDTSGGLDAEAWGVEQLNEMMRLYKETHDMSAYYNKGAAIGLKHPAVEMPEITAPVASGTTEEEWKGAQAALMKRSKLPEGDMLLIARQAIEAAYQLSADQMEKLAHNPGLSWYFEKDGQVYYEACLVLIQQPSADPNVFPDYIQMDGEYSVLINTGTGVVEDIFYDAALAGNG